jgi:cytochrome b involved in lipid metabolism
MEHRWMKLFVNGVWTRPDRTIKVNGVEHDMDEYAKQHGIELPDAKKSKKTINTDVEDKHEDMERSHDTRNTEVDGDGDSEGTE